MSRLSFFEDMLFFEGMRANPLIHTIPRPPGSPRGAPYFQNVFDLFDIAHHNPLTDAVAQIAAWENQSGRLFPAALAEFYTARVTLPTGGDDPGYWTLTLPELWSEYSNDERAPTLGDILQHTDQPRRFEQLQGDVLPGPYSWVMTENQGVWLMQVRHDGSDDPVVYADAPTFLSPADLWEDGMLC